MIDDNTASILYPGRIVTYYPSTQTADIKISAEKIFSNFDGVHLQSERELLKGVPVHTPYGGGWSVTFPIKSGDTCLIAFSQIGYDHWFYDDKDAGGTILEQPVPPLMRQFSEDDGFAMVGFNTIPRKIASYHPTHSQWRNEDVSQVISLNDDGSITVTSPVSLTVNAPNVTINCTTAEVNASEKIDLNSPEVNMSNNLNVLGTFNLNGLDMNNHRHPENDNGGPTDGPIN